MNNFLYIQNLLKSSPVFNFSLGSKELFHSNFIAWFTEQYPESATRIFAPFCGGSGKKIKVDREKEHKDITFTFNNGSVLIIENKVKSMPSIGQLEKYNINAPAHTSFLLLSLARPAFALPSPWQYMSYGDLSQMLKREVKYIRNVYHHAIICDYIMVIQALNDFIKKLTINDNDIYDFHIDLMRSELQKIRIGDLYHKMRYQIFGQHIESKLSKIFPRDKFFVGDRKDEKETGKFYINSGMTRSQGLVEIAYVIAPGLFITTQIQGNRYKQMVQGYGGYGRDAKRIAEILRERGWWFVFGHVPHVCEYPKGVKIFNKYGTTDFYRSVSLDPRVTIGDIMNAMACDIQLIKKKERDIGGVLK
jgi:hypothetical protein